MRSARPSTSVRSIRPFSKARRANSPGSARRTPRSEVSASITRPDHGAAAMNMQLGDVLAGEARGPRQPEREPAVEHLAGPRVPDLAQGRLARRRRRTAQRAHARLPLPAPRCGSRRRRLGQARSPARRWCPFGSWNSALHRSAISQTECVIVEAIGGQMTDAPLQERAAAGNRLRPRDEPLSPPAPGQPRQLVGLGARGARRGQADGKADPALGRLRRLPLVPRDGA